MNRKIEKSFDDMTHVYGRIFGVILLLAMVLMPVIVGVAFKTGPDWKGVGTNTIGILITYWAVCIIEFFTYVPMLGSAGSYVSFITGDITTLRAPGALNAMNNCNVSPNTEEGELVSTISITISSIITITVAAIGVLIIVISNAIETLNSPELKPAFENVVPALFGALGVVFISKNWKLAMVPVVLSLVLFIAFPNQLGGIGAILVPVFALISIFAARLMYKKGFLGPQGNAAQESEITENKADKEIEKE